MAANTPTGIKVGTFNMRLASKTTDGTDTGDNAWPARQAAFASTVLASGASICGWQEVSWVTDSARSQAVDAINEIRTQAGNDHWTHAPATDGALAIAWDDSVIAQDTDLVTLPVNVVYTVGASRAMAWAIFRDRATNTRFIFAVTHWQHDDPDAANGRLRRNESSVIVSDTLDRLRADYGLPAVLVADFNDWQTGAGSPRAYLTKRGYVDARTQVSFVSGGGMDSYNGFDPSLSGRQAGHWIDGIYVSSGIDADTVGLQLDFANGGTLPLATPLPSDHSMVTAGLLVEVTPDYKHLTLDLLGGGLKPAAGSMIHVSTDRDVDVKGVGRVSAKNAIRSYVIGRDGAFPTIDAIASLDPALQDWSKGFAYIIRATPGPAADGAGVVGGPWKVVVNSWDDQDIRLTDYQGGRVVPAVEVDWQAIIDTLDVTQSSAASAVAAATDAQTKANSALALAQTSVAPADTAVHNFVLDTGSQTREALDATYMQSGATAWSKAGLTATTSIDEWGDHTASAVGVSGLRVIDQRVEIAVGFTYVGPKVFTDSLGNFPDITLGTITDAALRPQLATDFMIVRSGLCAFYGRLDETGAITLTAGTFAGQYLATGTALRFHASWAKQ